MRKVLNLFKRNEGITLIEIITSIAIISILLVSLLTIFSGNLQNVMRAGKKTKYVFSAQAEIDETLKEIEEGKRPVSGGFLKVDFKDANGQNWSMQVNGEVISAEAGEDTNKVNLSTFVPRN